ALRVHENRVGASLVVRLGATQCFIEAPSRYQRLGSRDEAKTIVRLAVFSRSDLPAELVDLGQRLKISDERVGLREQLVLDAHRRDISLAEFLDESPDVVKVAVAGVAVEQNRQVGRVVHELQNVQNFGP